MTDAVLYAGYEIFPEVFQHKDGRNKGSWGSVFRVRKEGDDLSISIVAAAGEKSAAAAEAKALRRAKAVIDERIGPATHKTPLSTGGLPPRLAASTGPL